MVQRYDGAVRLEKATGRLEPSKGFQISLGAKGEGEHSMNIGDIGIEIKKQK